MKKIHYITEMELIFGSNNYLKNIFSIDAKDKENESVSDLWYDCDHVKLYGEAGRGGFPFIKHENKGNTPRPSRNTSGRLRSSPSYA